MEEVNLDGLLFGYTPLEIEVHLENTLKQKGISLGQPTPDDGIYGSEVGPYITRKAGKGKVEMQYDRWPLDKKYLTHNPENLVASLKALNDPVQYREVISFEGNGINCCLFINSGGGFSHLDFDARSGMKGDLDLLIKHMGNYFGFDTNGVSVAVTEADKISEENLKNIKERSKNSMGIAPEAFRRLTDRDSIQTIRAMRRCASTVEDHLLNTGYSSEQIIGSVADYFLG